MPERFFFDLINETKFFRDNAGVEAADLNQAVKQALAAVAEIRESGELDGASGQWKLVVRDGSGKTWDTLSVI